MTDLAFLGSNDLISLGASPAAGEPRGILQALAGTSSNTSTYGRRGASSERQFGADHGPRGDSAGASSVQQRSGFSSPSGAGALGAGVGGGALGARSGSTVMVVPRGNIYHDAAGAGLGGAVASASGVMPLSAGSPVDGAGSLRQSAMYSHVLHGDELDESAARRRRVRERWVTVFGFPPGSASFVEQEFRMYGEITQHALSPAGNWMHLHYADPMAASRALAKHATLLGDTLLIGVVSGVVPSRRELDFSAVGSASGARSPRAISRAPQPDSVFERREPDRTIWQQALEYLFGW